MTEEQRQKYRISAVLLLIAVFCIITQLYSIALGHWEIIGPLGMGGVIVWCLMKAHAYFRQAQPNSDTPSEETDA